MPVLCYAVSTSKRRLESDAFAASTTAADDKSVDTAAAAAPERLSSAERRARRVPSSCTLACNRPVHTHVGCMLLCALLFAALLLPAASAVPARGALRRARRAAAAAAAPAAVAPQLASGYGADSSQLKLFGRCALEIDFALTLYCIRLLS